MRRMVIAPMGYAAMSKSYSYKRPSGYDWGFAYVKVRSGGARALPSEHVISMSFLARGDALTRVISLKIGRWWDLPSMVVLRLCSSMYILEA